MLVLRSAFPPRRVARRKRSDSTRGAKPQRDNRNGSVVRCDKPDRETRSRSSRIAVSTGAVSVCPARLLGTGGRHQNRGLNLFRADFRLPFPLRAGAAQAILHPAAPAPSVFRFSTESFSTCQLMWLEAFGWS